jgi:hypothetical protein
VLGDWFPAFVRLLSLQLRFEEGYDSGEGLLLGLLLHCSMMMMLIVD